jgi:signal transduction histidine kinase
MDSGLEQKTAAYLTHELRAPLTSIRCALELLSEEAGGLTPDSKECLAVARRNVERLKGLIDDILDLSKVQAGRMRLFPVPADPAALVREAVESLQPWARKRGVVLSAEAAEGCPKVSAEPRRVVQILTNLISNAIKFTPAGGSITVRAEAGRRDDAGYGVFSVSDTGCGIHEEDQGRLFRFFCQAGTAEQRSEGTGLGLALSRSLVEIQGGTMRLESRVGEGSTFSFTLPVHMPLREGDAVASLSAEGKLV